MRKFIPFLIVIALIMLLAILFYSPINIENVTGYFLLDLNEDATEKNSPYDRIKEEQIKVYDSLILIHINNSELVSLENTNSMDPLIDEESNVIQINPQSVEDIHIGDIISYQDSYTKKIILHRVVAIGEDKEGKFFTLMGDNVNSTDPVKVRFEQIRGIAVAVIY
tara:strand:+ start:130 stop:627 length:498 start_codon:yes stop_codon:yes gene_type:complete